MRQATAGAQDAERRAAAADARATQVTEDSAALKEELEQREAALLQLKTTMEELGRRLRDADVGAVEAGDQTGKGPVVQKCNGEAMLPWF